MVLFKDMNKDATDLLTKDFCSEKTFEVEHKFACPNPQFSANGGFTSSSSDKTMTMKFSNGPFWDEVKFSQMGVSSVEGKVQVPQMKGLAMGFKFDNKKTKSFKECLEFSGEYSKNQFHGKATISPFNKTFSATGMGTFNFKGNMKVGGEMKGGYDKSSFSYTYGAGYGSTSGNYSYFVSCKMMSSGMYPFGKFAVQAHGKTNTKFPSEFAAEYQKSSNDKTDVIQFGGQWYFGDTNSSKFKAKIGSDMKANFAVQHKFSNNLTGTFGTQHDFSNNSEMTKYGFKFDTTA